MKSRDNRGSWPLRALFLLLLAVGTCAVFYLLKLRFEAGDTLPRGSTLRSDPLGIEVLYESLNRSGVASAERNYFELQHAELENFDMLVLSHSTPYLKKIHTEEIHSFVTNHGGRLLITFAPESRISEQRDFFVRQHERELEREKKRKEEEAEEEAEKVEKAEDGDESEGFEEVEEVEEAEECDYSQDDEAMDDSDCSDGSCSTCSFATDTNLLWYTFGQVEMKHKPATAELNPEYECGEYDLPLTLSVKTVAALSTNLLDNGWQAVYSCSGMPVVVERICDKGSVVISTLSYPFSNEAMRAQRETGFLLWTFDDSRRILFDESHFGLVVSRTVAKLIRKNNLHYSLLALLIPALLYFRMASVSLIPRYRGYVAPQENLKESSGSALSKLLMRSVSPASVVSAALEGWLEGNRIRLRNMADERRDQIEELVEKNRKRAKKFPREKEIVAAYNEVVDLLNEDDF